MTDSNSTEVTDEEIKALEAELAAIDSGGEGNSYGSPTAEKKDSTLVLFRELIHAPKSTKFGNLIGEEMGLPNMSVRGAFNLAHFFDSQGLVNVGDYFRDSAEITLATSLSRKGKLIDNIVTQIKKEKKESTGGGDPTKKSFFNKFSGNTNNSEGEQ